MKDKKVILRKIISGTLASSILFASCTKYYNVDDNSIYGDLVDNNAEGEELLNMKDSNLSEEFKQTVLEIRILLDDITSNKESAKLFINDPSEYIKKKGLNFAITLTNKDIKLLQSFTDEDIKNALKAKDLKSFLRICKEKGYIELDQHKNINELKPIFKDDDAFEMFKSSYGNIDHDYFPEENLLIPLVAIAIAYVGVVLYAAAAVDVAVAGGAVFYAAVVAKIEVKVCSAKRYTPEFIERAPVFKLWLNSNEGEVDFDVLHSELIEKQSDAIVQIMLKEGIIINDILAKKIITTNLEAYYGLRK